MGGADVAVGGADPEVGGADPALGGADPALGGADIAVGGADPAMADADAAVGGAGCSVDCVGTAVVDAGPVTPATAVCNIGASSVTNDATKSSSLKMFSSNGQIPHARNPAMAFSGVEDLWKADFADQCCHVVERDALARVRHHPAIRCRIVRALERFEIAPVEW